LGPRKEEIEGNLIMSAKDDTGIITYSHFPVKTVPNKFDPNLKQWSFKDVSRKDVANAIKYRERLLS
jgi:hypothetical protein